MLKKFRGIDDRATVGKMLFRTDEKDIERLKKMLRIMWSERRKIEEQRRGVRRILKSETCKKYMAGDF